MTCRTKIVYFFANERKKGRQVFRSRTAEKKKELCRRLREAFLRVLPGGA